MTTDKVDNEDEEDGEAARKAIDEALSDEAANDSDEEDEEETFYTNE